MSKLLWKSLALSTALVAGAAISPVLAQDSSNSQILDQIDQYNQEGTNANQGQVRSITELRDVSPGDWAYDALRNLVENYDCIEGYPNRTFRGDRPLTRYEFAAGLNACLDALGVGGSEISREEFDQLKRLVNEFEAELATLGTRVDNLEGRVSFLEDHQFSTTTKLKGEAIFAVTDIFGGDADFVNAAGVRTPNIFTVGDNNNTIMGDRVRLTLESSFTGEDKLVTRLAAGNLAAFGTGTIPAGFPLAGTNQSIPSTTQTFNLGNNGNNVALDWAAYYLPVGKGQLYIAATGGIHSDYANTNNPYFEDYDGGNGALSTFASENPIYRIGGGAGVGVNLPLGDKANVTLGYLADNANNPGTDRGLFNGGYAALGQVDVELGDNFSAGLTYVHGYHNTDTAIFDAGSDNATGFVGSFAANNPSRISNFVGGLPSTPTVSNSYGAEVAWMPSEKISISGFFNYTDAILINRGDGEIWSYGLGVAFPDLGKEGNVLGIFAGASPYLGSANVPGASLRVKDTPYHVEAFYKYKVNDNISITPGLIWLSSPEGDFNAAGVGGVESDDAFIGTLRTTFTF